jgi:hypothetical protein
VWKNIQKTGHDLSEEKKIISRPFTTLLRFEGISTNAIAEK